MLYLKKLNDEDIEKEYEAVLNIPENENGFENPYFHVSKEEFKNTVLPLLMDHSLGRRLKPGYVPDTYFFLWDDQNIVGLFKIRHYLTDFLIHGAGHIGYAILKPYRNRGYATKGLQEAIKICRGLIREEEIYLSCRKDNPASLKVQMKCGAYLTGENDEEFFTRIKLNQDKNIHFGIRDLRRDDWQRLIQKTVKIEEIRNECFEGKVCLLTMKEVKSPLEVDSPIGRVVIADNNYRNLIIAPKDKHWWLTVMFNAKDEIIESYFDITRLNDFYDEENPFFIDMKLDVCIPYGHEPSLMDEEELKEVLELGMITPDDYRMAYETAKGIIAVYQNHQKEYYESIRYYFEKLMNVDVSVE